MLNYIDKNLPKFTPFKKNKYKRFNIFFIFVALFPVSFIGLFNSLVDPYGVTKAPTLPGWNLLKPAQDNNIRLFKSIEVIQLKPKIVFLGSSRAILGLDPNHPVFLEQPGVRDKSRTNTYNLGLTGAYIDEVSYYLQHIIANQKQLETVILGLDFYMFKKLKNSEISYKNILGKTQIPLSNLVETTFSVDTFKKSLDTVNANWQEPNISADDFYYIKGMRNNEQVKKSFAKSSAKSAFEHQISTYFSTFYQDYELDVNAFNKLKTMVEICKNKNIELKIFISPIHAAQLETIREAGLWPTFEKWKAEVTQIVPVWDFATYNSITTEAITNERQYFFDSAHYSKKGGDLVLNRLYNYQTEKVPSDFGILITSKNVETHLQTIRINREKWAKNNLETINLVKNIK